MTRKRASSALAALLALALAGPALANGDDGGHHDEGQASGGHHDEGGHGGGHHDFAAGQPGKPANVDRTVTIRAKDIAFAPSSIEAHGGETVRFVVKNTGKLRHSFVVGTKREQRAHEKRMQGMSSQQMAQHNDPNMVMVPPGETRKLVWRFAEDVDGQVTFACHVPGHYQQGMRGQVALKHSH